MTSGPDILDTSFDRRIMFDLALAQTFDKIFLWELRFGMNKTTLVFTAAKQRVGREAIQIMKYTENWFDSKIA